MYDIIASHKSIKGSPTINIIPSKSNTLKYIEVWHYDKTE